MICFVQKHMTMHVIFFRSTATSPVDESSTFVSTCRWWYYSDPVYALFDICIEFEIYVEVTDYRSNFAKTILFENCSCFSKTHFSISVEPPRIFQCLISIPAGHWVRQIDGRKIPRRFFLSVLLSLVISMTRRSELSTRALRDGADVVRETTGNLFFVRICYMFLISKCRGDRNLSLRTTSVLAFEEQMRDGKIWGENVFWRRRNRILPFHCGSPNERHRPRS